MTLVPASAVPFANDVQLCANRCRISPDISRFGVSIGAEGNALLGAGLGGSANISSGFAASGTSRSSVADNARERARLGGRRPDVTGCLDFILISRSVDGLDGCGCASSMRPTVQLASIGLESLIRVNPERVHGIKSLTHNTFWSSRTRSVQRNQNELQYYYLSAGKRGAKPESL